MSFAPYAFYALFIIPSSSYRMGGRNTHIDDYVMVIIKHVNTPCYDISIFAATR